MNNYLMFFYHKLLMFFVMFFLMKNLTLQSCVNLWCFLTLLMWCYFCWKFVWAFMVVEETSLWTNENTGGGFRGGEHDVFQRGGRRLCFHYLLRCFPQQIIKKMFYLYRKIKKDVFIIRIVTYMGIFLNMPQKAPGGVFETY